MKHPRFYLLRFLPVFVIVACMVNIYLAFSCFKSSVPREIVTYHEFTNVVELVVTTNFVSVVSNSVDGSISPVPAYSPRSPSCVCRVPYQYFINGRLIGAHVWGRFYYDGSPCSYGKIASIYPDRILLQGGDWIENSRSFDLYDDRKARLASYDGRAD